MKINEMVEKVYQNAIEKGWHTEKRSFGELIALCHCELSEAIEEYRNGRGYTEIYYNYDKLFKNKIEVNGEITRIIINRRKEKELIALIDTEDLYKLIPYNKFVAKYDNKMDKFYVRVNCYNDEECCGKSIHRIITMCPKDYMVDHINGDTLDNRKQNLRVVTASENQFNLKKDCGVYIRKSKNSNQKDRYYGHVGYKGKIYKTNYFDTFEEAYESRKVLKNDLHKIETKYEIPCDKNGNKKAGIKLGMQGIPIELADVVIRIMDMCGLYGIDLEEAIETKMEYNKTRPYRHGGKKI